MRIAPHPLSSSHISIFLLAGLTVIFTQCAAANALMPSTFKQLNAVYEFPDKTNVLIQIAGEIDSKHGEGVLVLKSFELSLSGRRIGQQQLKLLMSKIPGIKLETIRISRYAIGETPADTRKIYVMDFQYFGFAFDSSPEVTKKMSIEFNDQGIIKIK